MRHLTTPLLAAATALASVLAHAGEVPHLTLRGASTAWKTSVAEVQGTNDAIRRGLETDGFRAYSPHQTIASWLSGNRPKEERLFVAVPVSPATTGYELRTDANGDLCLKAPPVGATVVDPIAFLVKTDDTPAWTTRSRHACGAVK